MSGTEHRQSVDTFASEAELARLRRQKRQLEDTEPYNTAESRKRARQEAVKQASQTVFRPKRNAKIPRGLSISGDSSSELVSDFDAADAHVNGGAPVPQGEDVDCPDSQLQEDMRAQDEGKEEDVRDVQACLVGSSSTRARRNRAKRLRKNRNRAKTRARMTSAEDRVPH